MDWMSFLLGITTAFSVCFIMAALATRRMMQQQKKAQEAIREYAASQAPRTQTGLGYENN